MRRGRITCAVFAEARRVSSCHKAQQTHAIKPLRVSRGRKVTRWRKCRYRGVLLTYLEHDRRFPLVYFFNHVEILEEPFVCGSSTHVKRDARRDGNQPALFVCYIDWMPTDNACMERQGTISVSSCSVSSRKKVPVCSSVEASSSECTCTYITYLQEPAF